MKKMKLELEALAVESFDTVSTPAQRTGTVRGHNEELTFRWSWCPTACAATCDPSCGATKCVTACAGGGHISKDLWSDYYSGMPECDSEAADCVGGPANTM